MEMYVHAVGGVATVPLNWVNIASSHTGWLNERPMW